MVASLDPVSIQSPEMALTAAVWMGALASSNVCAVVRLPILAAYVAGASNSRRHALFLTVLVAAGLAVGTVLLGLTAAPMADGVHRALQVSKYLFWGLGFCLIVAGVLASGLIDPRLVPARWHDICERLVKTNAPVALLLGLVLGLLQTPACPTCRAELLAVVDSVPAQGSSILALAPLVGFALGLSLAVLGVGVLTGLLKPSLFGWLRTRMCSIESRTRLLTGNMLIVLGAYFVIVG